VRHPRWVRLAVPIVRVDITGPKSAAYVRALLRGVRTAVVEGLAAPDERVTVRVIETAADHCDLPDCRTDRFTVVEIMLYAGRDDAKKAACSAMMRELLAAEPGIPACDVSIAYHDMTPVDLDVLPGEASPQ